VELPADGDPATLAPVSTSAATAATRACLEGVPVLVTGATGFVGRHLVPALCRRGARVRALTRRTSDLGRLGELGVEVASGDLEDPASLERAASGQRLVFHTAARVSDWAPREELLRVNVDGTRNLVAACQAAGVERLVHVSSLTVLGLPRDGALVDEQTPCATPPLDPYSESKLAGELLVREANGRRGLATTVVRPGVVWGPGDTTIMPRFAALLRRRRMVLVAGGANRVALSHVANLVEGLILAATTPAAAGRVYHVVDGEELTAREAIEGLAEALGTPPPRLSLPFPLVYGLAAAGELVARTLGRSAPPRITRFGVRLVACDCRYDRGAAQRDLGYRPLVPFREGMAALAVALAIAPPPGDNP
jgi:nucleoside-diphosphate-sugar epimerase